MFKTELPTGKNPVYCVCDNNTIDRDHKSRLRKQSVFPLNCLFHTQYICRKKRSNVMCSWVPWLFIIRSEMYFSGQTSCEKNHLGFINSPGASPIYNSKGYHKISEDFRTLPADGALDSHSPQ